MDANGSPTTTAAIRIALSQLWWWSLLRIQGDEVNDCSTVSYYYRSPIIGMGERSGAPITQGIEKVWNSSKVS